MPLQQTTFENIVVKGEIADDFFKLEMVNSNIPGTNTNCNPDRDILFQLHPKN